MSDPPPPPSRAAMAAVMARAADSEPLLADRPVEPLDWGLQRVDLACGWSLWIWWSPGQEMGPLHAALAPNGARWSYGCDRWPDWLAGPAAVVLDPITHLIDDEQRERLRQRLLSCSCWPPVELPPEPPVRAMSDAERDEWLELMAS